MTGNAAQGLSDAPWFGSPGLELVGDDPERTTGAPVVVAFHSHPPLCPTHPSLVLFFHGATECAHSLTPHRASWAPGVDSHLRNLWELKNTHISNCAAHKVQCKPHPPTPHQHSASAGRFFIYFNFLCHIKAFPGRTVVYLCLISSLFFLSVSPLAQLGCFSNTKKGKWQAGGAEAGESGNDCHSQTNWRRCKTVNRCVAVFLCLTRCGFAGVSCYIRQLTGSYGSGGGAEASLKRPIQDQSKDHLWPTTTFLFFFLQFPVWCMQLVTHRRLSGYLQSRRYQEIAET